MKVNWLNNKSKFVALEIILLMSGVGIEVYAYLMSDFNLALIGVCLFFTGNLVFALSNIKESALYLIFLICYFTFLIGRPVIEMCRGLTWWDSAEQKNVNVWFALSLVFAGIVSLYIGGRIAHHFVENRNKKSFLNANVLQCNKQLQELKKSLQAVALVIFFVSIIFYFIQSIEPLIVVYGKGYLAYYTEFESDLPWFVNIMASFMKVSLCVFLSTLPTKRQVIIPLILFELSAVPSFLIGVRNPIILNSLFILIYYFLRDILGDKKKWIGKIEKICLGVSTPLVLVVMAEYAYIRDGSFEKKGIVNLFIEFFHGQGVTFEALQVAFGYREDIMALRPKYYTFGGLVDYVVHGTFGQKLWGASELPAGNGEINGLMSNSFAHNLSYISMREDYLNGHGRGSSYLLENYFDFGYIGVIIFSIVLGALLIFMVNWFGKKMFGNVFILMILTNIFFIPRAEATGWLTFIITVQFWTGILICYFGSCFVRRFTIFQKILQALRLYSKE